MKAHIMNFNLKVIIYARAQNQTGKNSIEWLSSYNVLVIQVMSAVVNTEFLYNLVKDISWKIFDSSTW